MHPSLRILADRVHTPLIRFLGKRSWPSNPETPHAHPFAPSEYQSKNYAKFSSSSSSSSPLNNKSANDNGNTFQEFWDAPERFWKPRVHELEEAEIDAILSGGASLRS
ncbi:hypothetical protein GYMLUDRAFT_670773 [Collybiopsis luxurians FD-317 M1]|uniref:Uncharacterized protein n=1 Tax=Collybiopsis luxurians FD-317 M1 TaxID=944289 RepID=A0A0D0B7U2_9AGAR|nr:hypothetical protein GYMLUDRAFT_670773 [Collybiopsis luxurians FD-317 M1]